MSFCNGTIRASQAHGGLRTKLLYLGFTVGFLYRCALQEMVRPGLLAVLSPCVVGLGFRVLGYYTGQVLLGAKAVAGLLMFSMVAGTPPHEVPFPVAHTMLNYLHLGCDNRNICWHDAHL